jgi:hypothetical protein
MPQCISGRSRTPENGRSRDGLRFLDAPNGTMMIDEFDYRSPFGFVGRLADLLFLERYMRRLLERRAAFLRAEAEARVRLYSIEGPPGE